MMNTCSVPKFGVCSATLSSKCCPDINEFLYSAKASDSGGSGFDMGLSAAPCKTKQELLKSLAKPQEKNQSTE